jgi:AraC-like DNA-binding protein
MWAGEFLSERLLLTSAEFGRIDFALPAEKVANRMTARAAGRFGEITFFETRATEYSILLSEFSVTRDTTVTTILDSPFLSVSINLADQLSFELESGQTAVLDKGSSVVTGTPRLLLRTSHRANQYYATLTIAFASKLLLDANVPLSVAEHLKRKVANGIPFLEEAQVNDLLPLCIAVSEHLKSARSVDEKENAVREILTRVMSVYASQVKRVRLFPSDIDRLELLRDTLAAHPERGRTLKELALEIGMNEFKLKHGFRELFGMPVFRFVFEQRMKRARELLNERDLSISDIAERTGYRSPAAFVAAFKRHYGIPPGAMR